jgi:cell division protein FtsB
VFISSSTSGIGSGSVAGTNDIDRQIQQLQKRKTVVLKEITEVVTSGDSEKDKKDKLDALNQEMVMLDAQIALLISKKEKIEEEKQKQDLEASRPTGNKSNNIIDLRI